MALLLGAPTRYHVSPTGDDLQVGSRTEPWRTLNRASRFPFSTGDALLLERNGTWVDDPLVIIKARGLLLGAYGNETLPRPLIQLGRSVTEWTACASLMDVDQLTVQSLHVSGCADGLVLRAPTGTNATNVAVIDTFFRDIRTPFLSYNPANPGWARSIWLAGGHFKNLTVRNNFAARIDVFFSSSANVVGMALTANTVQQCSGNCYNLGAGVDMVLRDSVLLRDMSTRLFLYGTTDIIVGGLRGNNSVINNDFNARGEYQGGPDGCAFDFETAASGFVVSGNTFYRSWGAGIMIFGHESSSQGIRISENTFAYAGCVQNRGDRGGIAVVCPNGHKPSGLIRKNHFFTCGDGTPAIYVNPAVQGCADNLTLVGNLIDQGPLPVAMPQVSLNPPPPTSSATSGVLPFVAVTKTDGATLRYTLDGSRPTEYSPVVPEKGVHLPWPSAAVAINVRGFKTGMLPSVTNGLILELNYGMGRMAHTAHPGNGHANGMLDSVRVESRAAVLVSGWVVDTAHAAGWSPVAVVVRVDDEPVAAAVANEPRPDLPKAKVAPNAEHGFSIHLNTNVSARLSSGSHSISVAAVGSPSTEQPFLLRGSPICVCNGAICPCGPL